MNTDYYKSVSLDHFEDWQAFFYNTNVIAFLDQRVKEAIDLWEHDPYELNPSDGIVSDCWDGTIIKELIKYCPGWQGKIPIFATPMYSNETLTISKDPYTSHDIKCLFGIKVVFLDGTKESDKLHKLKEERDDDANFDVEKEESPIDYINRVGFVLHIYFRQKDINKFKRYAKRHYEYIHTPHDATESVIYEMTGCDDEEDDDIE